MSTSIPAYRHHKPSGQAVVTLNGHDFYLGKWKSVESRQEYDRRIAEWISNGRRLPQNNPHANLSIAELAVAFLDHACEYYANDGITTSEYNCISNALRPLIELYSRSLIDEFGPLALKAVRQQMIDRGWSRPYINRQVNRIRRMFRWGVENELVSPSILHALCAVAPLKRGRTAAPDTEPIKPVSNQLVTATIPHVSRQVAAMINLQLFSGARPGEIVQLRPCDLDRREDVWVYRPARHKTQYRGREREIYFGPLAQFILLPFLNRDQNSFCFSPLEAEAERNAARRKSRKTPMTPSQARRRPKKHPKRKKRDAYTVYSYRRAIKYACQKANIEDWHPNQLRHSCATKIRQLYGLDAAQIILGHKQCDVTQVYAELDRTKAIQILKEAG